MCSYTKDLHPYYILALAATVSDLDAPALKDAIYKYLTCKTSVGIHVPVRPCHFRFHLTSPST
jgi:hypothetical protein